LLFRRKRTLNERSKPWMESALATEPFAATGQTKKWPLLQRPILPKTTTWVLSLIKLHPQIQPFTWEILTPDYADEPLIRTIFDEYGVIEEIRMQKDKGFAFVKFQSHDQAARAIASVHGRGIGSKVVKCSWGKERTASSNSSTYIKPLPFLLLFPILIPNLSCSNMLSTHNTLTIIHMVIIKPIRMDIRPMAILMAEEERISKRIDLYDVLQVDINHLHTSFNQECFRGFSRRCLRCISKETFLSNKKNT